MQTKFSFTSISLSSSNYDYYFERNLLNIFISLFVLFIFLFAGPEIRMDSCCRTHDLCPTKIRAYENKYNITNNSLYTKWVNQSIILTKLTRKRIQFYIFFFKTITIDENKLKNQTQKKNKHSKVITNLWICFGNTNDIRLLVYAILIEN